MDIAEQIEKMDWELSQKDPERHAEITATYEDMLAKLYTNKPVYLTESESPVEEVDEEVRAVRWYKDALETALRDNARQRSQDD
jgi:hypothetical protein